MVISTHCSSSVTAVIREMSDTVLPVSTVTQLSNSLKLAETESFVYESSLTYILLVDLSR